MPKQRAPRFGLLQHLGPDRGRFYNTIKGNKVARVLEDNTQSHATNSTPRA